MRQSRWCRAGRVVGWRRGQLCPSLSRPPSAPGSRRGHSTAPSPPGPTPREVLRSPAGARCCPRGTRDAEPRRGCEVCCPSPVGGRVSPPRWRVTARPSASLAPRSSNSSARSATATPARPQGLALAHLLLSDPDSPLYRAPHPGALYEASRAALLALVPAQERVARPTLPVAYAVRSRSERSSGRPRPSIGTTWPPHTGHPSA